MTNLPKALLMVKLAKIAFTMIVVFMTTTPAKAISAGSATLALKCK
jgi:hypothetical protein